MSYSLYVYTVSEQPPLREDVIREMRQRGWMTRFVDQGQEPWAWHDSGPLSDDEVILGYHRNAWEHWHEYRLAMARHLGGNWLARCDSRWALVRERIRPVGGVVQAGLAELLDNGLQSRIENEEENWLFIGGAALWSATPCRDEEELRDWLEHMPEPLHPTLTNARRVIEVRSGAGRGPVELELLEATAKAIASLLGGVLENPQDGTAVLVPRRR